MKLHSSISEIQGHLTHTHTHFFHVNIPHLIGWLSDRGRVLRLQGRGLRLPIGLHHLCGAIRRRLLHDGHSLQ